MEACLIVTCRCNAKCNTWQHPSKLEEELAPELGNYLCLFVNQNRTRAKMLRWDGTGMRVRQTGQAHSFL